MLWLLQPRITQYFLQIQPSPAPQAAAAAVMYKPHHSATFPAVSETELCSCLLLVVQGCPPSPEHRSYLQGRACRVLWFTANPEPPFRSLGPPYPPLGTTVHHICRGLPQYPADPVRWLWAFLLPSPTSEITSHYEITGPGELGQTVYYPQTLSTQCPAQQGPKTKQGLPEVPRAQGLQTGHAECWLPESPHPGGQRFGTEFPKDKQAESP